MNRISTKRLWGLAVMVGVALLVLVLDQLSKAWVTSNMVSHDMRVLVEGFLRLRYTENTGAAFGIFQGFTYVLSLIAVVIIAAIVLSASRVGNSHPALFLAMGLVLGGALGNLTDRLRFGHVIDFVEVYGLQIKIGDTVYTWPVFNVADSAITVGVILTMLILLFGMQEQPGSSEATPRDSSSQAPSPEHGQSPSSK